MIGVEISIAKKFFFDRRKVQKAMDRVTHRAMYKAGAFVRKRARSSLRRTKKISKPGEPPRVHTNDDVATLKFIVYQYYPKEKKVLVGVVKLNMITWIDRRPVRGAVPGLLEFGGDAEVREWQRPNGKWVNARDKRRLDIAMHESKGLMRVRRYTVAARPFMRPALAKEAPNFPKMFYNLLDKV